MSELARALVEHAYLERDFVLRAGRRSRYYLDKYRFETRAELLRPLGERIAQSVVEHEPEAARLAGPELGAVALAASASIASGLPFLIVRKRAKEYGTSRQIEGVFEPGELICLVEDVVTCGARGGPPLPQRDLRGRPRGGRRGRAREGWGAFAAPLPGRRVARAGERPR